MSQASLQTSASGAEFQDVTGRRAKGTRMEAHQVHRGLSGLFSGRMAVGSAADSRNSSDSGEGYGGGFMAQATNYSRMMHEHTRSQMRLGTLPAYTKTMHAFTKSQMNHVLDRRASKSEHSSSQAATSRAMLPQELAIDLTRLTPDEEPQEPANPPDSESKQKQELFAATRRRSVIEPVPQGIAAIRKRDFAVPLVK